MPFAVMRDGARLHYHDLGRRQGPICVLLHGFAMSGALWAPFVAPYLSRYRFILPDLRGFGRSHALRLSRPVLLDQHADDVADLLDYLGADRIHLGGLSMGACTSMQFHRRYGFERVRSYLHVDQAPCVLNGPDWQHGLLGEGQAAGLQDMLGLADRLEHYRGQPFRRIPRVLRRQMWQQLATFYSHAFHQWHWQHLSALARYEILIRRVARVDNWSIYLDCVRAYARDAYDWRSSLPAMQVPTTVLVGLQSTMYPAAGQLTMRELVPHARVVALDNCGHAVPFEQPRRFVAELGHFLMAA